MSEFISVHLGASEGQRRKQALEQIARRTGAVGQRGPSISKLLQMVADGQLEVVATDMVAITSIDTVPEKDYYKNLAGYPTKTVLHIDPQAREAHVYQAQDTGNTLLTVWHDVELQTTVNGHPDEEELRDYLTNGLGQELLRRICDGHEVEWDGSNHRGAMSGDARRAFEALQDDLMEFDSKYEFWDADDWLYDGAEQRVTARTTDEKLAEIAKEFEATAEAEDVVLDEDILKWLTRYRDGLWDDEEG